MIGCSRRETADLLGKYQAPHTANRQAASAADLTTTVTATVKPFVHDQRSPVAFSTLSSNQWGISASGSAPVKGLEKSSNAVDEALNINAKDRSMTPALKRALRTLLQGLVAALGTLSLNTIFQGVDPIMIGGLQVVLTSFVSQVQNALEDKGVVPVILKDTPAPPAPPAPAPIDTPDQQPGV